MPAGRFSQSARRYFVLHVECGLAAMVEQNQRSALVSKFAIRSDDNIVGFSRPIEFPWSLEQFEELLDNRPFS